MKQPDKAASYYEQSLAVSTRSRNFRMIAITIGNLTGVSNDAKDYARARSALQAALDSKPEGIDKARLLSSLGNTYLTEAIGNSKKLTIGQLQRVWASPSPLYSRAVAFYQQALAAMQTAPDPLLQGDILSTMGGAYLSMGEHARSIEPLKQALLLFKQVSNHSKELDTLMQLMRAYGLLGNSIQVTENYQKGLNTSEQILALAPEALALAKALNQPVSMKEVVYIEVTAHFQATQIYLKLQDLPKAKEQAERAWTLAKQSGEPNIESIALSALQGYYTRVGDYAKLFEVRQRELEIARLNSNPYEAAQALTSLASSLLGNPQQELQLLQEATARAAEITPESLPRYATAELVVRLKRSIATGFATFYMGRGDYDQVLVFAQQALELSRQISDRTEEITSLLQVASTHYSRQDYTSAQQTAQQALTLAKTLNKPELEIKALIDLSKIAVYQGNPQNALKWVQQALIVVQRSKPKSLNYDWVELELDTLAALSGAYQSQGNYAKALEVLQQGITLSQQTANPLDKQNAVQELGVFYFRLGDYTNATSQFQQMLELAQIQQYPLSQQGALSLLSQVAFAQQRPQQAIQFAQQGLDISRQMQYPAGELSNIHALSRGYGELGDDSKAMAMAQATLDLARKMGVLVYQRSALQTLGDLHRRFGRWDEALASYETAIASGNRSTNTYAGLAQVYVHRNQPVVAITFYKQVINGIEYYRRNLRGLSLDLQKSYLQMTLDFGGIKMADIYRQLADLLISQGQLSEAQQVLELLKIQEINDVVDPNRSNTRLTKLTLNSVEVEIQNQHANLIAIQQQLKTCKPSECSSVKSQLQQFRTAFTQFITVPNTKVVSHTTAQTDNHTNTPTASASKILNAKPNTVLIYPLVLADKVRLLWATADGDKQPSLNSTICPLGAAQLNAKIQQFQNALRFPGNDAPVKAAGKDLYECLIKPIEEKGNLQANNIQTIVLVPDLTINYIPLAALHDGKQYLVERYTISSALNAEYTDVNTRLPKTPSVLGFGLSEAYDSFFELPNVATELKSLVKPTGMYPGKLWMNQKFTRSTLESQLKQASPIIHIATHGEFIPAKPLDSYLLLSSGTPGKGDRYSIAQMQFLKGLNQVHLIVLSACETAKGEVASDGRELQGINSYFLRGDKAKSVLASLWKVNDASTSTLMQRFYQNLAKGTMTKAEALRQAQLSFLQTNLTAKDAPARTEAGIDVIVEPGIQDAMRARAFSHPYYWAPFILIGNGL